MQKLFLELLKISIQSTFLILVIFSIKKIARRYLTPKTKISNTNNFSLLNILSYTWFLGFVSINAIFIISSIIFSCRLKKKWIL